MVSLEKSISWPQEAIYSLLEKVKDREVLWNIKHKDYPKKTLRRVLFEDVGKELRVEFPSLKHLTADAVLSKFAYFRGHFQKQLRKVLTTPSGSGGKVTPRWEYFQACSFLMPVYSNLATASSCQLQSDDGEVVYDGSLEDLLEGDVIHTLPCQNKRGSSTSSCSTSSPLPSPSPSPSTGSLEPPSDIDRLLVPSSDIEKLPVPNQCKGTPHISKKRKISNNTDPVRDSLIDTLHIVQSKFQKEDAYVTTCVRGFMQYSPNSSPKVKERCTKVKERFTEKVLQLITETMKEIHSEAAESD